MLHINDLGYRIGGRVLFDGATAHIAAGQRVGLVGRNGAGKTTLFRMILGEVPLDGGEISMRPRMRAGCVAQESPDGETDLLTCVLQADEELTALTQELETADGHRIGEIHERLETIGGHSAPSRASAILSGLGFPVESHGRPVKEFSGGWRMRVALAAVLFAKPDLLLLDEPTNHLDMEATMWLESHLAGYPGTLLIISHDRDLLNRAVNRILHLDQCRLYSYAGGYDRFERTRSEKIVLQAKANAKQMEQRRAMQAFVDRFRAKASKARQAQSRLKMLEKMGPVVAVVDDTAPTFDFPGPDPLSPPLIALDDGVAGYGDTVVLRGLNLRIDMDDRIALLGANGNGKSTLAKVLSGRLALMAGKLQKSSKLRVGYFAQHQTEELSTDRTPFEHMADLMPMATESKVRAHLGRFAFSGPHGDVKVEKLSGGEKARLLFALMSHAAPHIMILDEPTNHLDIDTRESLVAALNAYDGAVILITHDPHLVELTADRLWLVDEGACVPFEGDLEDYRKLLLERRRGAKRAERDEGDKSSRKDIRRAAAEARAKLAPLRKKAQQAEKRMEALEAEKLKIEILLADQSLYDGSPDKLADLQKKLGEAKKGIAKAEAEWIAAQEVLEEAGE